MRFYKDNKGMTQPFKIVQGDGTTAKSLTGITVKWFFKERDGTEPSGSPITGSVTDATNGLVDMIIPANMFTKATRYTCRINLTGTGYDEDTDPFNVDIDDPTAR